MGALDTGRPAVIAELEEARRMLGTGSPQLALRVLDCAFGCGGGIHVLRMQRVREVAPEPAALVWFLCILGRDPLGRDGAAVLLHVEQRTLLSCLGFPV